MSATTTRRFYAIEWIYGRAVDARTGDRLASYHSFLSASERDAWVEGSKTDYVGNAGYRESIPASDAELRRLQRREDGWYYITEHTPDNEALYDEEQLQRTNEDLAELDRVY